MGPDSDLNLARDLLPQVRRAIMYTPMDVANKSLADIKIDLEKINFLATLPSMDELRGKILGIISAPAQKIALIMKEPAGQIARLVSAQSKSLEESN